MGISSYLGVRPTSDIYNHFLALEVASQADFLRGFVIA